MGIAEFYWTQEAKAILRAELGRRGITYARLVRLLQAQGVAETERAIANKVSRGTFSFVFFLQVMRAIGVQDVDLRPTQPVQGLPRLGTLHDSEGGEQ